MTRVLGSILWLLGVTGFAFAGLTVATPEVDPSSAVAALALLFGGLLVLRTRRKN